MRITGTDDGFVSRIDAATGAIETTRQFGEGLSSSRVGGIAFTTKGNSVLETLGLPQGNVLANQTRDIETQTSARLGDHFFISVDGGTKKKITLEKGDTFDDIARKLRIAAFSKFKVEVTTTGEGPKLKISAKENGATINLIGGTGDRDLLARIGIKPGKLLPEDDALGINQDDKEPDPDNPLNLGGAFGLKIDAALNIADKKAAKYVLGVLDTAISTIQRAFRSLEFDPIKAQLLANAKKGSAASGPPPPRIAAQIANYQEALRRLESSTQVGSTGFFF